MGDFRNLEYEAHDGGEGRGERNCVAEALEESSTNLCPLVSTGFPYPATGIRILDSFYLWAPTTLERLWIFAGGFRVSLESLPLALSPQRDLGFDRDVILPTAGRFGAFYGIWRDSDGNGLVFLSWDDYGNPRPENEWVSLKGARMASFVSPGAHPTFSDYGGDDPDFEYDHFGVPWELYWSSPRHRGNLHSIVFIDGSLLEEYEVLTLQNFTLVPTPEFPFTPQPDSLLDVDAYAALLSGPLSPIYSATLAPLVHELGSPSLGWCPTKDCGYGWPKPVEDLPPAGFVSRALGAESAIDGVLGLPWYRYPREFDPGSTSTPSQKGYEEYRNGWEPWIDLIPEFFTYSHLNFPVYLLSIFNPLNSEGGRLPLLRGGEGGKPWIPPGSSLTVEVWVGAWRDLDGDRFVGRVGEDPYKGGSRPLPDDYRRSRGEFLPGFVLGNGCIPISVIPEGSPQEVGWTNDSLLDPLLFKFWWRGEACSSVSEWGIGLYRTDAHLLDLPFGTLRTGLTVCAGPVTVQIPNVPERGKVEETLFDCDPIGRFDPLSLGSDLEGPFFP